MAITDFLGTQAPKADLEAALRVVREFRRHESEEEYFGIPFACWAKLEQLEEFLEHLVEGAPLREDTQRYLREHPLPLKIVP